MKLIKLRCSLITIPIIIFNPSTKSQIYCNMVDVALVTKYFFSVTIMYEH